MHPRPQSQMSDSKLDSNYRSEPEEAENNEIDYYAYHLLVQWRNQKAYVSAITCKIYLEPTLKKW